MSSNTTPPRADLGRWVYKLPIALQTVFAAMYVWPATSHRLKYRHWYQHLQTDISIELTRYEMEPLSSTSVSDPRLRCQLTIVITLTCLQAELPDHRPAQSVRILEQLRHIAH